MTTIQLHNTRHFNTTIST